MLKNLLKKMIGVFPLPADSTRPTIAPRTLTKQQIQRHIDPTPDRARMAMVPKKNHAWNPATKFPRNEPCFCGSGVKAKRCCLPTTPLAINAKDAAKIQPLIKVIRGK